MVCSVWVGLEGLKTHFQHNGVLCSTVCHSLPVALIKYMTYMLSIIAHSWLYLLWLDCPLQFQQEYLLLESLNAAGNSEVLWRRARAIIHSFELSLKGITNERYESLLRLAIQHAEEALSLDPDNKSCLLVRTEHSPDSCMFLFAMVAHLRYVVLGKEGGEQQSVASCSHRCVLVYASFSC